MYPFDFAIENVRPSLKHELINLQASTELKHRFDLKFLIFYTLFRQYYVSKHFK